MPGNIQFCFVTKDLLKAKLQVKILVNQNQLAAILPCTVTAILLQYQNHYGTTY